MREKVRLGSWPAPRAVDPGLPRALEDICLLAMARDPERRYPSVAALRADVEAYLAGRTPEASRGLGSRRPLRWLRSLGRRLGLSRLGPRRR